MSYTSLPPVHVPVYQDLNGIAQIVLFEKTKDDSFKRTRHEPLRMLRNNITGTGNTIADLIPAFLDRKAREWHTPTVLPIGGRPQSYYRFLRDELARNRLPVGVAHGSPGHIQRLAIHSLELKPNLSAGVLGLIKDKYAEAIGLLDENPEQVVMEGYAVAIA